MVGLPRLRTMGRQLDNRLLGVAAQVVQAYLMVQQRDMSRPLGHCIDGIREPDVNDFLHFLGVTG